MSNAGRVRMTFKLNPRGVTDLASSKRAEQALTAVGDKIADTAKSYGGRFSRKRWFTETRREGGRIFVRAGTDQPAAHWDEWGTIYRAPRAPLRRALQANGLWSKTKESGR